MRKYKSDPGREKWRASAAEKQKKVRKLEIRVRDLEPSRANWKALERRNLFALRPGPSGERLGSPKKDKESA